MNLSAFDILRRSHDIFVGGKRRYRKNDFVNQLKNIGFTPILSTYRLPVLFTYIIVKKFIHLLFHSSQMESDFKEIPSILNYLLFCSNKIENKFILNGINMPFGSSLFVVARRK